MSRLTYTVPGLSPGRLKALEVATWVAMAAFLGFSILLFTHRGLGQMLQARWPLYIVILAVMYVTFLVPTRLLARYRRYSAITLETSRKGFTYDEGKDSKTFSWRDIKKATVVLDVHPAVGVYMRRLDLSLPKVKVRLDNEPPRFALTGAVELLHELEERGTDVTQTFVWYYPVCPWCRHGLSGDEPCQGCGRHVRFRNKLFRPWDVLGENTMFVGLFLILILLGPNGVVWSGTFLMVVFWALMMPMVFSRPARLQVLEPDRVPASP